MFWHLRIGTQRGGGSFDPKGVQYWTEVDSGKAYAGMVLSQPTGTMIRKTNQLNVVVSGLAAGNRLTDTAGSPSESYDRRHLATVLREWRHEFWHPFIKPLDLTRAERVSIEARVRKELYP